MQPWKRSPIRVLLSQHNNTQAGGLNKLIDHKQTSDIILQPETKSEEDQKGQSCFYCHKVVLWARWPALQPKLNSKPTNSSTEEILRIPDVDGDTLKYFIHFLYTDQIVVHRQKLEKIEETSALQTLMDFAHKQQNFYLVGMCNALLGYRDSTFIGVTGSSSFNADLASMIGNPLFADVDFVGESDNIPNPTEESTFIIPAHKAILTSRSDYFKAMFDPAKQLRESKSRTVHLPMHKNVLSGILSFLYASITPKKSLNERFATSLLAASNQLMIDTLGLICEVFLIDHLDHTNVCGLFNLADALHSDILREECLDFITRNYIQLTNGDELKVLDPVLIEEITEFFRSV